MPYSVLVPRGRALELYLRLRSWARARELLRGLATDPRPAWARRCRSGWRLELPRGEWLLYEVDDERERVTVLLASRAA